MHAFPKILVVDDYEPNRTVYAGWLEAIHGIEVVQASGGQQALQLARQHDFAMFLLDINMPDMDGFELASMLRQEPRAESTPIVFVTSEMTARPYLMRGYRMGAVDFMVSAPVQGEILVQKARVFLQIFNKRRELQRVIDEVKRENRELHGRLEDFVREQEALRLQATHDSLTRLPNRVLLQDRLRAALARALRSRQRFALAYIDLDGFKAVNDLHGHAVGDTLIVSVAERLAQAMRGADTVARMGGDEFAVLIEGLESAAGADYVVRKVHALLTQPTRLRPDAAGAEIEVSVGASIGVAIYPDHATTIEDLAVLADMTMYAVKRSGGGHKVYPGPTGAPSHLQLIRAN